MKIISLLISILLITACASTPQSRLIITNSEITPIRVELSNTPFFPQDKYECGPAALATILNSKGVDVSPEELVSKVYLPQRKGSLQIEMIATARSYGMLAYQLDPKLSHIFKEVAAGNPVLVLQNLSFKFYPRWHYAVVVGYDLEKKEIILRSGKTKRWVTPLKVFERTWQRGNYWSQAIVPAGQIPETATAFRYLKSAYAFEELSQFELALKAYQVSTEHWPDVAETWMTFGNISYKVNNFDDSGDAFNNAAQIDPTIPGAWNNLAYALSARNCHSQSITALQCGIKFSPNDSNLKNSMQELKLNLNNQEGQSCPIINCPISEKKIDNL